MNGPVLYSKPNGRAMQHGTDDEKLKGPGMKNFLSLELSEFLQAPIFRFLHGFKLVLSRKSKNQRSSDL
jgi:hypothetical protein